MGRIVIISNRVIETGKTAQAGGVAVALADTVGRRDGMWVGWNGNVVASAEEIKPLKRRRGTSTVLTTPLSTQEHFGFYLGYANSVLWPVFHNRLDLAQFEAGYYRVYKGVNERFAALLAPLLEPDDTIWVHDYQFITLGSELRKRGFNNPIGFFLHIPFPPFQSFLAVPEHRQLAEAFASYNLVGLQTSADVGNMLAYLQQVDGRILTDGRIRAFNRIVAVESFPIGIDSADFEHLHSREVAPQAHGSQHVRIVGIDRLDYTKGLPQKLRAFGRFLELAPQFRRKVVLTQIAPPTRESVEAYADIRKELEALSGEINGRFGELDWVPIHYMHRSVPRTKLEDIYRASRVGLVTPLRDGMNLVAKEYVAAQHPADPGVLILSQFAGAAEQMKQALIVNPYNIDEMANALLAAIEMPLSERIERHGALLETVRRNGVAAWSESFMASLARHASRGDTAPELVPRRRLENLLGAGADAERVRRRNVKAQIDPP